MLRHAVNVLRSILGRDRLEADLSEELRDHLERETELHRSRGLSDPEARRAALLAFGGVERVRDEVRDARGLTPIDDLRRDVRLAVRRLQRNRAYSALVVTTVALGMGAAGVIFSAVDGVLLKPLPYADPERLVTVWQTTTSVAASQNDLAVATFLDLEEQAQTLAALAAANPSGAAFRNDDVTEQLEAWTVTENFFAVVGAAPLLGRSFRSEDFEALAGQAAPDGTKSGDSAGASRPANVVLLDYGFWQRQFAGRPDAVDQTLVLNGAPHTVIGVMPRGFRLPERTDVWLPNVWTDAQRLDRFASYIRVFGRLRPQTAAAVAQAEMDALGARLAAAWPRSNSGVGFRVVPLADHLLGRFRGLLFVLLGAVSVLMLVTVVNVGALQTVRLAGRRAETAMLTALGARWRDLARPVVVETLVLVGAGAAAGLALATWGARALRALAPADLPGIEEVSVDWRTTMAILVLALVCAVAVALVSVRRGLVPLTASRRPATATRAVLGLRRLAVGVQLALALVLLVGTSLLVRSFLIVMAEDRGYETTNVLTFSSWVSTEYPNRDARLAFVERVTDALSAVPGVAKVGVGSALPLAEAITGEEADIVVEGQVVAAGQEPQARATVVTPDYFPALGVRLTRGRLIDATDSATGRPVVVVTEAFARQFLAGRDPLGRQVAVGLMGRAISRTVVGVVNDVRHVGLDRPVEPGVFIPYAQQPIGSLTFIIRTNVDPAGLARPVAQAMGVIDPRIAVARVSSMDTLLQASLRLRTFLVTLLALFAGVAVLIAVVGVYGVMSQSVAEREREIAVRMAIGATRVGVVGEFLTEAGWMTGAGVLTGLVASAAATRAISGFLYGVAPLDPMSVGQAVALVVLLSSAASLGPAWRATSVEPRRVLQD
jgi:putative ABC transport system permease protein